MVELETPTNTVDPHPSKKKAYCLECVGWCGSIMILIAYVGSFTDLIEFWLNILGSVGLLVICWRKRAYQPMFLNSAWIVGSIYNFSSD